MLHGMNRKRLGGVVFVGLWAMAGAIVIACGDDDVSPPTNTPEAGVDSAPTSTSTSTPDTGPPDANKPADAGTPDADASDRAIWAFRAYCGDGIDAGCPTLAECPALDGGI